MAVYWPWILTVIAVVAAVVLVVWLSRRKHLSRAHFGARVVLVTNAALVMFIVFVVGVALLRIIIVNPNLPGVQVHRRLPMATKAIVFMHGWTGSPQSWDRAIRLAHEDPRLDEFDILSASYPTFLGGKGYSLSELASWFSGELSILGKKQRLSLIAHSFGGVLARRAIILGATAGLPSSVDVVISIGSPFLGANVAELGRLLNRSETLYDELKPESATIKALRIDWDAFLSSGRAGTLRSICIASPADLVVPPHSAQSQCTNPVMYAMWGHTELPTAETASDPRYATLVQYLIAP